MVHKCIHDDKVQNWALIQDLKIKRLFHVQIIHTLLIKSRLARNFFFYFTLFTSRAYDRVYIEILKNKQLSIKQSLGMTFSK